MSGLRYMDRVLILSDLNLDLMSLQSQENDERRVLLEGFMSEFGLDRTFPHKPTWCNSRGASSRIDYLLFSGGTRHAIWSEVLEDSDPVLGTDHKCCSLALQELRKSKKAVPSALMFPIGAVSGKLTFPKPQTSAMPYPNNSMF